MKRYISVFLLNIICFVLQTTIFQKIQLANVGPNFLVIITAVSGFMYGRKLGMFSGVLGGLLMDTMYSGIIGVDILIYAFVGYLNGMANKLYFKEDIYIPLVSIAISDFLYGLMYYMFRFLLRGRLDLPYYVLHVMIPEMIYTMLVGVLVYLFMRWLEEKMNPEEEVALAERAEKEKGIR